MPQVSELEVEPAETVEVNKYECDVEGCHNVRDDRLHMTRVKITTPPKPDSDIEKESEVKYVCKYCANTPEAYRVKEEKLEWKNKKEKITNMIEFADSASESLFVLLFATFLGILGGSAIMGLSMTVAGTLGVILSNSVVVLVIGVVVFLYLKVI